MQQRVFMRDWSSSACNSCGRRSDPGGDGARVRGAFAALDPVRAAMGTECWRDYSRKLAALERGARHLVGLPAAWPRSTPRPASCSPGRAPDRALQARTRRSGLRELGVDEGTARWALANGHLMRDRFTVADLAFFMGSGTTPPSTRCWPTPRHSEPACEPVRAPALRRLRTRPRRHRLPRRGAAAGRRRRASRPCAAAARGWCS